MNLLRLQTIPFCIPESNLTIDRITKAVCEPQYMYRFKKLFCTCSLSGSWKTAHCLKKFQYLLPDLPADTGAVAKMNTKCTPNAFYLIDCNICRCDTNGLIRSSLCTSRTCKQGHKADTCAYGDYLRVDNQICLCSDVNYYIDQLCLNINPNRSQIIELNDLSKIIFFGPNLRTVTEHGTSCTPHSIYFKDCNRCVCIQDGQLMCTNKNCLSPKKDIFSLKKRIKMSKKSDFLSLPELKNKKARCKPGVKYRLKCNICYCTPRRIASCTTMLCLEDFSQPLSYGQAPSKAHRNESLLN